MVFQSLGVESAVERQRAQTWRIVQRMSSWRLMKGGVVGELCRERKISERSSLGSRRIGERRDLCESMVVRSKERLRKRRWRMVWTFAMSESIHTRLDSADSTKLWISRISEVSCGL